MALLNDEIIRKLASEALSAREFSYSPYSKYRVGAALLTSSGRIFRGCNIENSSYSATVCAERTAFFKAIGEGKRDFSAIAIVGGKNGDYSSPCTPCGVCLQVMSEFCGDGFKILLQNGDGINELTLKELLPNSFKLR